MYQKKSIMFFKCKILGFYKNLDTYEILEGIYGIVDIIVGNMQQHEVKSWMRLSAYHIALIPLEKIGIQYFFFQ